MWNKITRNLKKYQSAVLTGMDAHGSPFSVRCVPEMDANSQVLHVQLPPGVQLHPGPASLLCHQHNELLWNLESFLLRGSLMQNGQGWNFQSQQFIPGGPGTGLAVVRSLLDTKRAARRYLQKRHLPRPRVPWDEIVEVKAQALRAR
jgi:hypothetical protein